MMRAPPLLPLPPRATQTVVLTTLIAMTKTAALPQSCQGGAHLRRARVVIGWINKLARGGNMNRLDGKVAFLSGAARGIGGATAKLMASSGAKVAIGDLLDERGRQTAKEIEAAGGQALYVSLDVTQEGSWAAALDATAKKFGKLDVLVNNAGIFNGKG